MRRASLLLLVLLPAACRGRDDLDGRRRPIPGLGEAAREHQLDRHGLEVACDLYDNRAAAVVYAGGQLRIDAGGVDFAKYADGGYRGGWHFGVDDGGRRAALIDGLGAELGFPLDRDPGGVARGRDGSLAIEIEARSARPSQLVSVFLNQVRLGDISMPTTEWRRYTIRAPAATVQEGENRLRFYFRSAGQIAGHRTAAAVGAIAIGEGGGAAAPPRAISVSRGEQQMTALQAPGPSRLSYYLQVPRRGAELLFAIAGPGPASVRVAGQASGAAGVVWEGGPSPGWAPARVDLTDFADEVVRIDLVSQGPVAWGRPQLLAAPAVAPVTAPGAGRRVADHVIVWVVSALRYDRFAVDPPLPGFARLLERGIRFLHATSAAPAPGPAHVALMTGRHPSGSRVPDEAETLAERFRGAGYATALISGNGFVHDEAGFARGFDTYSNPMRLRHPFGARILWQKARRVLTQHRDGHVFLYLATVEPHLPYTPAEPLPEPWSGRAMRFAPADTAEVSERVRAGQERLSEEEQAYVVALYDAEVREAAAAVGEMLADLEQLGLADRTAIVLVADHGEELWERGRFGHGDGLYQETLHVPLVVVPPGLTSPQVVEREVELIDVFPTVLDLAGIAVNPSCQGRSLLGREADEEQLPPPVQAHLPGWGRSLRLGRYQLVVPLRGGHQLYDLTGDPAQREDLAGSLPLVERYLRNVFGLAVAYQTPWSRPRWGAANNTKPAFAADHGL